MTVPVYLYTHEGVTIERNFRMATAPSIVMQDGKTFKRDIAAECRGLRTGNGGWPMWSDAAGCHPSQAKDMRETILHKGGPPVEINGEGQLKFESRSHRRAVLKALGYIDRASYTGY